MATTGRSSLAVGWGGLRVARGFFGLVERERDVEMEVGEGEGGLKTSDAIYLALPWLGVT